MEGLASLIMVALAAHYVDYVVTESALFAGVRSYFAKKIPMLGEAMSCYNCMAYWSAVFTLLLWAIPQATWFVVVLAAATLVQFLMQWRWKSEP